jgi:transitional endoplasmic reticulum ATPase
MRNSSSIYPSSGIPTDSGSFPAERLLRRYAASLVRRLTLDENSLAFYLSLLGDEELHGLFADLRARDPAASKTMQMPSYDRRMIGHQILNLIFDNTSNLLPSDFTRMLYERFRYETCEPVPEASLPPPAATLVELMELSSSELAVLSFVFLLSVSSELERLFEAYATTRRPGFIALCTGLEVRVVMELISETSRLYRLGLLVTNQYNYTELKLADLVARTFLGTAPLPLHAPYTTTPSEPSYPLESFRVDDKDLRILQGLLASERPVNLLLYGVPGTGKTEFAKALAQVVGKTARFLTIPLTERGFQDRRLILQLVLRMIDSRRELLVIDEADGLLNVRSHDERKDLTDKAYLNQFLETVPCTILWITNTLGLSHESVRRRFAFSLHFEALSVRTRKLAWASVLADRMDLVSPRFIEDAARRFTVNTAGISQSVSMLRNLDPDGQLPEPEREAVLSRFLERHQELTIGQKPSPPIPVVDTYDPAALNTDTPPDEILVAVGAFYERRRPGDRYSMNLLFHGLPGTGKTEFARYLAETLDRELIQRRASDLLSMWVGGTEQQIAAAFRQAEAADGILLLDEADSLFLNRTQAQRSWERSQTNELLTQMETYSGVLVCCTNVFSAIDPAALRRFSFKVGFRGLSQEGRLTLFRRYFPDCELTLDAAEQLAGLDSLTPGDFKAVFSRIRYKPVHSAEVIVAELELECSYRKQERRIGFTAV